MHKFKQAMEYQRRKRRKKRKINLSNKNCSETNQKDSRNISIFLGIIINKMY